MVFSFIRTHCINELLASSFLFDFNFFCKANMLYFSLDFKFYDEKKALSNSIAMNRISCMIKIDLFKLNHQRFGMYRFLTEFGINDYFFSLLYTKSLFINILTMIRFQNRRYNSTQLIDPLYKSFPISSHLHPFAFARFWISELPCPYFVDLWTEIECHLQKKKQTVDVNNVSKIK